MIEDWQLEDSLGSFELAMEIIRQRYLAGEQIPETGYFQRPQTPDDTDDQPSHHR